MNLFQRASQKLPLTPGERAFIKLIQGWVLTALSAGIMAGAQYLLNNQQVNWQAMLYIVGGAVLLSVLSAVTKYYTAQGDVPIAVLSDAIMQRVQGALPALVAAHISQQIRASVGAPVSAQAAVKPPVQAQVAVPQLDFPPAPALPTAQTLQPTATIDFGTTGVRPTVNTK